MCNIGLSMPNSKDYIVQLNVHHSQDKKYLILRHLNLAFQGDPDLQALPRDHLGSIMQSLYISTGCNYISYLKTFKAKIINIFTQYASFISGTDLGSLYQADFINRGSGFVSFVHLIGTCYFKKHIAAFIATYGHSTSLHLYNSIDNSLPVLERHKVWLQRVRQAVCNRILSEEERVPTYTSLWRHWLCSYWVHQMWQRSTYPDVYSSLPAPEQSGWIKDGCNYIIDWEAVDVMEKIKGTIEFLTKVCSCKKGCATNNCGCRKRSNYCGPGCECQACANLPVQQPVGPRDDNSSSSSSEDDDVTKDNHNSDEEIETEIVTDEFLYDCPI